MAAHAVMAVTSVTGAGASRPSRRPDAVTGRDPGGTPYEVGGPRGHAGHAGRTPDLVGRSGIEAEARMSRCRRVGARQNQAFRRQTSEGQFVPAHLGTRVDATLAHQLAGCAIGGATTPGVLAAPRRNLALAGSRTAAAASRWSETRPSPATGALGRPSPVLAAVAGFGLLQEGRPARDLLADALGAAVAELYHPSLRGSPRRPPPRTASGAPSVWQRTGLAESYQFRSKKPLRLGSGPSLRRIS